MVIYMTKMTYAEAIAMVLEMDNVKANEALTEKLEALQNSLQKKASSKDKKPTARQKENESIKATLLDIFKAEPNRLFSVTELCKMYTEEELSNQKMSALLRQMVSANLIERVEEKRKAFFTLV